MNQLVAKIEISIGAEVTRRRMEARRLRASAGADWAAAKARFEQELIGEKHQAMNQLPPHPPLRPAGGLPVRPGRSRSQFLQLSPTHSHPDRHFDFCRSRGDGTQIHFGFVPKGQLEIGQTHYVWWVVK